MSLVWTSGHASGEGRKLQLVYALDVTWELGSPRAVEAPERILWASEAPHVHRDRAWCLPGAGSQWHQKQSRHWVPFWGWAKAGLGHGSVGWALGSWSPALLLASLGQGSAAMVLTWGPRLGACGTLKLSGHCSREQTLVTSFNAVLEGAKIRWWQEGFKNLTRPEFMGYLFRII